MDERPFPHGPLPQPPPSRRGFLLVGTLAVAAAGGGVWWALSADESKPAALPTALIDQLHAASRVERELIATVGAALKHVSGSQATVLRQVHTDHVAHLRAIQGLTADAMYPLKPSASSAPVPSTSGRVRIADVRTAETRAAQVAAKRAASLSDEAAVLLASIAACEATHAELLR